MIKKFINMKLLIIFILFVILFTVSIPCLASNFPVPVWAKSYRWYVIFQDNDGIYRMWLQNTIPDDSGYTPSNPSWFVLTEESNFYYNPDNSLYLTYEAISNDGYNWSEINYIGNKGNSWERKRGINENSFKASNVNIKGNDGNVFFSPPTNIMAEEMKKVESGILLRNILNGLTLTLGLLVSATCFRKGLEFLRTQLMRS